MHSRVQILEIILTQAYFKAAFKYKNEQRLFQMHRWDDCIVAPMNTLAIKQTLVKKES